MAAFLSLLADYIYEQYGNDFRNLCVIFPNRRAGLFFRRELGSKIDRPVLSPQIFSFEDFIFEVTPFIQAEPFEKLITLYKAATNNPVLQSRDFDGFLDWGQNVLRDFDEVDAYLIDPARLFPYLRNVKQLATWNLGETPPTEFQNNYLRFYDSMFSLYMEYHRLSMKAKKVSTAMAARWLAENSNFAELFKKWDHIVFAGFYANTPAEEKIISALKDSGKAEIFYDADLYYIKNKLQEVGLFLRDKIDPEKDKWILNRLRDENREIKIIGVAGNVSQTTALQKELEEKLKNEGTAWLDHAAIVLANEDLLIPVLDALPLEIEEVNVTMGLPLIATPVKQLVENFLNIFIQKKDDALPARLFYRLIHHPYIWAEMIDHFHEVNALRKKIMAGQAYLSHQQLNDVFKDNDTANQLVSLFFEVNNSIDIGNSLLALIDLVKDKFEKGLPQQYLYVFSHILYGTLNKLKESDIDTNPQSFLKLMKRILASTKVPFYGEPLKGLQIMGMLETRALDFDTVFLLSANDDILPGSNRGNSFIPFDVRIEKEFNLPVDAHQSAISAYHFYRLLQGCKQAFMFYNSEPGGLGGGEKSRFILQIENEFPLNVKNTKISTTTVSFRYPSIPHEEIVFTKTPEVMKKLTYKAQDGLSPSALWTFNVCGVKFYFDYMVGLIDYQITEGEIDEAVFGTVVHKVLQEFYPHEYPFRVTEEFINNKLTQLDDLIRKSFQSELEGIDIDYGRNKLLFGVAQQILTRFFQNEIEFLKDYPDLQILNLEKVITYTMPFPLSVDMDGSDISLDSVVIHGRIDRIDQVGEQIRIIDYKTGKGLDKKLSLDISKNLSNKLDTDKAFQLLTYLWMYKMNNPKLNDVKAGIMFLRRSDIGFTEAIIKNPSHSNDNPVQFNSSIQSIQYIEQQIKMLLRNLFDLNQSFVQTSNKNACRYCKYKFICARG